MAMTVDLHPEQEMLRAAVGGEFSLEDAKKTFLEIVAAVVRHKAAKVLFDGREVTGEPTALQRFEYGAFVAGHAAALGERLPFSPQFAYVLNPPVLDPHRLGEHVAANRGMYVRAFDNLEAALAWLGVKAGGG